MKTPYDKLFDHVTEYHEDLLPKVQDASHAHLHYMHSIDHLRHMYSHHEYVFSSTMGEEDVAFEDQQ